MRHVDDAGALDLHRTDGVAITIIIAIFSHLTADAPRNLNLCDCDPTDTVTCDRDHPLHLKSFIGRSWRLVEELHDRGPIEPRSRSDRTAIAERSSRDRGAFNAESTPRVPDSILVRICSEIDAQSTHDQATIVVDRGESRGENRG